MKKFICVLLAAVVAVSMFTLTACGGKTESQIDESSAEASVQSVETSSNSSVFPAALSGLDAYPFTDVSNTGWTLSGGMINNIEMEQSDLDSVLTACGGTLQYIFVDATTVNMINGEQTFEGTYETVQDGYAIHMVFTGYEYYGVLTAVDGVTVIIISNVINPNTALYLTQIDEG